jgi:galactokinase/mevalonate kinase-like predicted kinase
MVISKMSIRITFVGGGTVTMKTLFLYYDPHYVHAEMAKYLL